MANRKKKGYAQKLITRINEANPDKLGVKLGKLCVQLAIPISDVAGFFDTSKPTIYSWFTGQSDPRSAELRERVERIITKLELKVKEKGDPSEPGHPDNPRSTYDTDAVTQ